MIPFRLATLIFALVFLAAAALFGILLRHRPELYRKLPRHRVLGVILGTLCLAWAAWYALPLLEGGMAKYQNIIKLLVPVVAILAYFYLNFIFARALGGFLILAVTMLLASAFANQIPVRWLYSLVCYAVAIGGMFLIAAPWLLRDVLQKCTVAKPWRVGAVLSTLALAAFFAAFALA